DLGDIIVTPLNLYRQTQHFDLLFQFSVWTPSGHFSPGDPRNRGSGFWSLIYSGGAVWYPSGDRRGWSVSGVAGIEQDFRQRATGITPGDDFDIDWGVGRFVSIGGYTFELGVSGFATWQITDQDGGDAPHRYRYFGAGPEASAVIADGLALRIRA